MAKKKRRNWKQLSLSLGMLSISLVVLYAQLSRVGYVIPFSRLTAICWRNCVSKATASIHSRPSPNQLLNYEQPIAQILALASLNKANVSILIEKSQYRLTVYYEQQPVKSYPVVFGGDPVGDKLREGDRRTPEGIFKIRDLYPHESWSKFIWLDYPNDASWEKHLAAKRQGKIPWSATIGGEIGIHGVPTGEDRLIDRRSNWTLGCISLKNPDVDELYPLLQAGTAVEIVR